MYLTFQLDGGLQTLMQATDLLWKNEQSFLTYVGGSRSRRSGIFAGVTDPGNAHVRMYINNN